MAPTLTDTDKTIYNHRMNKLVSDSVNNVQELKREIFRLRSAVISIVGEDEEGTYRPEFVKEMLRAAAETPEYRFRGKNSFLADLAGV